MDIKVPLADGRVEDFIQNHLVPSVEESCSVQFYATAKVSARQPLYSRGDSKVSNMVFILTANNIYIAKEPPQCVESKIPLENVIEVSQVCLYMFFIDSDC